MPVVFKQKQISNLDTFVKLLDGIYTFYKKQEVKNPKKKIKSIIDSVPNKFDKLRVVKEIYKQVYKRQPTGKVLELLIVKLLPGVSFG